jgi:hypothetical protein
VLVPGTARPRSPHLVDNVVLNLEQDVDGDLGDRLGVTPTSPPRAGRRRAVDDELREPVKVARLA